MGSGGKIYLLSKNGPLTPMDESSYDSEDILQEYLASYSDLLAGEQIRPEAPLKWLFIQREIGIPGDKTEGDRWSLDHLFVDQEGMPTFVECKRSSDTRIRREVVGQMLDYAANAIEYWPVEKLRQSAAETAQKAGHELNDLVLSLLNLSEDEDIEEAVETFWSSVESNLREGNLRLLFVSDRIPSELRRVVEFLNDQMSRTEVIAIEVKQYTGGGETALVPRALGTQKRRVGKTPRSIPWTEGEFLNDLHARSLEKDRVGVIEDLLGVAKKLLSSGLVTIYWGKGRETGSFSIKQHGSNYLSAFSDGSIGLNMGYWKQPMEIRIEMAIELEKKLGFDIQYDEHLYPNIMPQLLAAQNGVIKLKEWLEYAIQLTESASDT